MLITLDPIDFYCFSKHHLFVSIEKNKESHTVLEGHGGDIFYFGVGYLSN